MKPINTQAIIPRYGSSIYRLLFLSIFLVSSLNGRTQNYPCDDAIYVTPSGLPSNSGTQQNPVDLYTGINLVANSNNAVRMQEGQYIIDEALNLPSDITIEGGYDIYWLRKYSNPALTEIHRSAIGNDGTSAAPALIAFTANNSTNFRLQNLTITTADGPDATATNPAYSTYGLLLDGCSNYKVVRCQIVAGKGGDGLDGTSGSNGLNGLAGNNGGAGSCDAGTCIAPALGGIGGLGGQGANGTVAGSNGLGRNGGGGGQGGDAAATCENNGIDGQCGGGSQGQSTNCNGGTGGVSADPGGNGINGADGNNGSNGANGINGNMGSFNAAGLWMPGAVGGNGENGTGGQGGRGGGGGGAQECSVSCTAGPGNGGGGGGGGGQGGTGGTGGTGGGSSFGLTLINNGIGGNLLQSYITTLNGYGGMGGASGNGGLGGDGGQGASTCTNEIGQGGNGGRGGDGGQGGNGGNGTNGLSNAIQLLSGTVLATQDSSFNLAAQPIINTNLINGLGEPIWYSSAYPGTWNFEGNATTQTVIGKMYNQTTYTTLGHKDVYFDGHLYSEFNQILNTAFSVQIIDTTPSCHGDYNGSATVSISGTGFPPIYEYNWANGEYYANNSTTNTATFLPPGTFQVTVVHNNNCSVVASPTVGLVPPDTISTLSLIVSPNNATTCSNSTYTFSLEDNVLGLGDYQRAFLCVNGNYESYSDSLTFSSNTLNAGDTVSVLVSSDLFNYDCYDSPANVIILDAFLEPSLQICNPTTTEIQLALTQGAPPWSFDLHSYTGTTALDTTSYTIYGTDTTLTNSPDRYYIIHDLGLSSDTCDYVETYPTGHINGCPNICVGYSPNYTEDYTTTFPDGVDFTTIEWAISPSSALANGDVKIIGSTEEPIITLDFSNATPSQNTLLLQATAMGDCGMEYLELQITLDPACVWPGDVNMDGQANTNSNINWIDDELALELARLQYNEFLNTTNGEILHNPQRYTGCMATNNYDWVPQVATDWKMETSSSTFYPADFEIIDLVANDTSILNLKYADCNGDGMLDTTQNWTDPFTIPFTDVTNPTDHDIVMYQALNGSQHQGNMPLPKANNFQENILIIPASDTVFLGQWVLFDLFLGSPTAPVNGVHHIAFVGKGAFGDANEPLVDVSDSHLCEGNSNLSYSYFFLEEDATGTPTDSLRWHVSLGRPDNLSYSVDFAGEEICNLTCHISVAGSLTMPINKQTQAVPVTFKIPTAGILLETGETLYAQSNTTTIWVKPNPLLNMRVLLEGSYEVANGLMRDDLRISGLIPATEPFSTLGFDFPNRELKGLKMTDSSAVLSVSGQEAIVDWVFVEIRDKDNPAIILNARPALLTRNGNVVDMDGQTPPRLWGLASGDYHVVIRHRNHLSIMTAQPVLLDESTPLIDFTQNPAYNNDSEMQSNGYYTLIHGDTSNDNQIDARDRSNTWNYRNQVGYYSADCNLDGQVDAQDRSITWNNRNRISSIP